MTFPNHLTHNFANHFPELTKKSTGRHFPHARLLITNKSLANSLGLNNQNLHTLLNAPAFISQPGHAMGYSGHQFGQFNPILGDGRALLLGELSPMNSTNPADLRDIHLKGSGPTPYSKPRADGLLPLGAALRELLISEFLHAIGIPTSRILAVFATGEKLTMPRNKAGSPFPPGAVVVRVARHHIRIGTFQYAALLGGNLTDRLLEYTLTRNGIASTGSQEQDAVELFRWVTHSQAELIARWMRVGFIHGVLNTDNVSLAGESIDFGPCAFLDRFDVTAVFSSIDAQGRYSYGNQPTITQWNLARFAETLIPLWQENADRGVTQLSAVLNNFPNIYNIAYDKQMAEALGENWQEVLSTFTNQTDYAAELHRRNSANPPIIPRNIPVQDTLSAAEEGDMEPFLTLFDMLKEPFSECHSTTCAATHEKSGLIYASDQTGFTTYCGT